MFESIRGSAAAFRRSLPSAAATQERGLVRLLQKNRTSEYGRQYNFGAIGSYREFVRRVPIVNYETLAPLIRRAAEGAPAVLTTEPIVACEETGGSSGGAKLIPYTEAALDAFRRGVGVWLDDLRERFPGITRGSSYWAVSPAGRAPRTTSAGIAIGLDDFGYLGATLGADIAPTLCVPPIVAALRDLDAWREATALHLLADARLALISVWSPSYLSQLLDYMQTHAPTLAARIAAGFDGRGADPARAALVASALDAATPDCRALWPQLCVLSCWNHAAASAPAAHLAALFPQATLQGKGLLATEGLVSIPLEGAAPVLAVDSGFVEFLDDQGHARSAADVAIDGEYEILLSNESGLYRYAIGDRVRIAGFMGAAPLLVFLGRSGVACDLVGEKLTEAFVAQAIATAAAGQRLPFAALAADADGYVLLLDAQAVAGDAALELARRCEQALRVNPQYAHARELGQLRALRPWRCHEPAQAHVAAALARGQRLGDIKPLALLTRTDWRETFPAVDPA
jgi:hypothetical protein